MTSEQAGDATYEAEITWTTHGVPHITAADWGGVGFGQGWACARDHAAAIFDHVTKVRSERARHLGRGEGDVHLHTDLGYLALDLAGRAERMRATQPAEITAVMDGYTAGVNAWLAEHGRDGLPAWCRDAAWVGPLEALDLWRVAVDLAIMGSGRNLVEYIGSAVPPGGDVVEPVPPPPPEPFTADPGLASNGWALGRDASATGRGMVMANPHFPWWGEGRFWECHLRIPGTLDVYGVSLVAAPLVQMGFNRHVGWSHTFSRGHRFTVYKVDLGPDGPTTYRYGDEIRAMTPRTLTVEVADGDGGTTTVAREQWSSHYGPMLNLPMLGWSELFGFTYRDANLDNDRFFRHVLGVDTADGMDAFQEALAVQGIPWVNTLAADESGRCWYVDASSTPNLTADAEERFLAALETDPITQLAFGLRVALLDGSDPAFEWQDDPAAPQPGVLPWSALPALERTDHVFNSNDPYWLANAVEQLPRHAALCGLYRDQLSPRTRINGLLASGQGPVIPTGPGGTFTADDLVDAVLGNDSLLAVLLKDGIVARLGDAAASGSPLPDGLDVAGLARVLDAWDGRYDVDAVGAVLWRELLASFPEEALRDAGPLFAEPYDPTDPLHTPWGLAPAPADGPDPLVTALAAAVEALAAAGIAPDARLGDVQYAEWGAARVPMHGGFETEGIANVIAPLGTLARADLQPGPHLTDPVPGRVERTGLRVGGYQAVYGVSFLMALAFTDDGPEATGLLVYGQSADPDSPHHADQLDDYVAKRLRPLRFTDDQIAADPNRVTRTVQG